MSYEFLGRDKTYTHTTVLCRYRQKNSAYFISSLQDKLEYASKSDFLSIHPNVIQVDRKTVSQNILQQDNQNYKPSASYMSFLIRFSPTLNIQKLPDFLTKHTLHTIMFYVILLYICICTSPHLIIISNLAVLRCKFFQCYTPRHEENSSPPQASQQRLVPVDESTLYTKNFHPCVCVCVCVTLATKILSK